MSISSLAQPSRPWFDYLAREIPQIGLEQVRRDTYKTARVIGRVHHECSASREPSPLGVATFGRVFKEPPPYIRLLGMPSLGPRAPAKIRAVERIHLREQQKLVDVTGFRAVQQSRDTSKVPYARPHLRCIPDQDRLVVQLVLYGGQQGFGPIEQRRAASHVLGRGKPICNRDQSARFLERRVGSID
jgi:hypothetical protein